MSALAHPASEHLSRVTDLTDPVLDGPGLPMREYLLVALTAAVVTFLLTGLVRVFAIRVGAVAWPRGRDVHTTPTPRWGGLAIYGGMLGGVAVAAQLPALRLAFTYSWEVMGTIAAAGLLALVGALDDRFELDAITKLAGQVTAVGVLMIFGVQWSTLPLPWGGGEVLSLGPAQSVIFTTILTVALVNGMNFVDGLDGLAAGLGMIAASAACLFSLGLLYKAGNDPNVYSPGLISALLAGACFGFLPHNFNPARIFMGDSGSMPIGLMLAAATVTESGRITTPDATNAKSVVGLMAPVIVLAAVVFVPLLDLLMAVVRRTRAGTSPFSPDKMHLHHRLLEIGHSQRRAVLLIYLWSGVLVSGAVTLAVTGNTVLAAWGTCFLLLLAVLATVIPRARVPKTTDRVGTGR